MKPETRTLTVHIPLPMAERLDRLADRLDRSKNWIVKQALSAWTAQEEERDRLTVEALADVDTGKVIDLKPCKRGPTAWTAMNRYRFRDETAAKASGNTKVRSIHVAMQAANLPPGEMGLNFY